MSKPHILLDLDGTLTESGIGITRSIAHALTEMGRPVPGQVELDNCIGPSLWEVFAGFGMDRAERDRAVALYRERYTTVGLFENRVYDGVPAMLKRLRKTGAVLCLATAKPHAYARKITAHFGLAPHLTHEFGSELDGTRSAKADLIAHILAETGADPARAFMMGDRDKDVAGALANNVTLIGAGWGYGQPGELAAAGAALIAATPAEAAEMIEERL